MRKPNRFSAKSRKKAHSFTLIELLTVMVIIAILAALVLAAANGAWTTAARSRARAEIQAMSGANEGYKADNGVYVQGDSNLMTNGATSGTFYTAADGTVTGDEYQTNSTLLYVALSSEAYYGGPIITTSPATGKSYMQFKVNQIGNPSGLYSYIKDPWNASYGYSTGTTNGAPSTNYPYTGSGQFDLWSTGGITLSKYSSNHALTNAWISNWTQ
jgi:prepilin-type N-terminal cleavage/methylation domain-containing protein